jgi:hypothetical protein
MGEKENSAVAAATAKCARPLPLFGLMRGVRARAMSGDHPKFFFEEPS